MTEKLHFKKLTFFIAVNIIDRFCSIVKINDNDALIFSLSAVYLAAKYEELRYPYIRDLVKISEITASE